MSIDDQALARRTVTLARCAREGAEPLEEPDAESLTRELSAEPGDLDRVLALAATLGLSVEAHREFPAMVILAGSSAALADIESQLAAALKGPVVVHPFLSGTRQRRPVLPPRPHAGARLVPTVRDLCRRYAFPPELQGCGQTVGIVLPGGGFAPYGLSTYFGELGFPEPDIQVVPVGPASNDPAPLAEVQQYLLDTTLGWPGLPRSERPRTLPMVPPPFDDPRVPWTIEGMMDVQILAGVVPQAKVRVYVCEYTGQGIHDALCQAADDGVTALSLSFSGPEDQADPCFRMLVDRGLMYAALKCVTVCGSSGNCGSTGDGDTRLMVNYPPSSPWILGCGGTLLAHDGEVVWNEEALGMHGASGGGFSSIYPKPRWQAGTPGAQRGVPDVASDAAYASGVWLWFDFTEQPIGVNSSSAGTSAAAPLWAGLAAILSEGLGAPLGFAPPRLYAARAAMQLITVGNNIITSGVDHYYAHRGWNACTGLGRPDGTALLQALSALG
jgi:kumamolisin